LTIFQSSERRETLSALKSALTNTILCVDRSQCQLVQGWLHATAVCTVQAASL